MGLSAGIIGLPNVGKSTIFNALTSSRAAMENYPFCTIEPNHGIAAVPDDRLKRITAHIPTGRVVPAFLELVDIAGLVQGASRGEGLGNQFLGHIKEVDALVMVTRCFEAKEVVHVDGSIDTVRDSEIIETELLLKDLDTVERALSRISKAVQTGNRELAPKTETLSSLRDSLQRGIPARQSLESSGSRALITDLHLLTIKPILHIANISDGDLSPEERHQLNAITAHAENSGSGVVPIRGKIESEIMELSEEERDEYLLSLGIPENGLALLARSLYRLLGLCSFFTVNKKELHAWSLVKGATAVEAAAAVHTDFARGFVRADVYSLEDLERYRNEAGLRSAGKIRSEGRDYIVRDGDIIYFRSAP